MIDDDKTCRFITEFLLNDFGICDEVISLENAVEGMKHFRFCDGDYPELVMLDINMPMMDAWEFMDWIEESGFSGRTNFVIYSSTIRPQDQEKADKYKDIIGYIEKPPTKESLGKIIENLDLSTTSRIAV